jgi:hypothetical protein
MVSGMPEAGQSDSRISGFIFRPWRRQGERGLFWIESEILDEFRTDPSINTDKKLTILRFPLRLILFESDNYFIINHNTSLYLPKLVDTYRRNTTPRSDSD